MKKTKVQFLVHELPPTETGEVNTNKDLFAFFPDENYNYNLYGNDSKVCYAHFGQHSSCHIAYAKESRPATEEEYSDLKKELESIGYELEIMEG